MYSWEALNTSVQALSLLVKSLKRSRLLAPAFPGHVPVLTAWASFPAWATLNAEVVWHLF